MILVPAGARLFSPMDEVIQHRRRYERSDVVELLEGAGFTIERIEPFNRLGVVGWSVNRWMGRTTISAAQVSAFRLMMPLARTLERVNGLPGLSWIAIGRKAP